MKLFLLHGWAINPNNQQKWQAFQTELKAANLDSTFLGLPGLSSELDTPWTLDDYIEWLKITLPVEPVVLLGHSFGGQLAIRFTKENPNRVKALILVASSGIRDHSLLPKLKRIVFKVVAKTGKQIFNFELGRKILYKLAREQDYYQANPVMRQTMSHVVNIEVREDLKHINQPTLIIWGEQDQVTPPWIGEYFHKNLKNSSIHFIKDARHAPQFTHPKELTQRINTFLKG